MDAFLFVMDMNKFSLLVFHFLFFLSFFFFLICFYLPRAKVAFCPRRASISKSCDRPTTAWQKVSRRLSALALTMNFYGNSAPNCGQRISSSNSSCSNTASCLRSTASHRRERNLNNRLSMEGGS